MSEKEDLIKCELCGELGYDYKETEWDHPWYAETDEYEKLCKNCFLSLINFN